MLNQSGSNPIGNRVPVTRFYSTIARYVVRLDILDLKPFNLVAHPE